ncbi:MAG TPA: pilus assembly protein [Syntrophomonadaceae bacterium]|nr:pilus assembly protein [Syntrophomonadaceae bacterium]
MDEKGQMFVEFAFCLPIFLLLAFVIISVSFWGLGNAYVREAAFEAARHYSVTNNPGRSAIVAKGVFYGSGGELFVKPETLTVAVYREGDKAVAEAVAEPRFKTLGVGNVDKLYKKASCNMEYRYRNPGEYLQ